MDKLLPKEVSSLSELPQYNNRSIDVPPSDLDFSAFVLRENDKSADIYTRLAVGIGHLFISNGLVEVESYVYHVKLRGKIVHYQVNVLGRDPITGQAHSTYLM